MKYLTLLLFLIVATCNPTKKSPDKPEEPKKENMKDSVSVDSLKNRL